MISRSIPSGSSTSRMRRTISTSVLRSLNTGTTTDNFCTLGCRSSSGKATRTLLDVPVAGPFETFAQRDRRFPSEEFACAGEIRLTTSRIVGRQWFEHDFGRRTRHLEHHLRELEHRVLTVVPDVDRTCLVAVGEREDAAY